MLESQDRCETVEGVTKGAIWTSYGVWESADGATFKELAGWAIGRKPGSTTVCQDAIEYGTSQPVMTDGKVTGWRASGQCAVTLSTGDWASLSGKTWHWTAVSTGPMTYEIHSEVK